MFRSKIFIRQFLSFFLIVLITVIAISMALLAVTSMGVSRQQIQMVESYRHEVSETIDSWLTGRLYSFRAQTLFIQELGIDTIGTKALSDTIAKELDRNENFSDISVLGSEGYSINNRSHKKGTINLSDREYFQNAMKGEETVTGFYRPRQGAFPVMSITEPIFVDGKPQYAYTGYISATRFTEIMEQLDLGAFGHAYLVDADGVLLNNSPLIDEFFNAGGIKDQSNYKVSSKAVEEVLKKKTGSGIYSDFMGEKVIGSYQWLDKLQAGLVVEFRNDVVMKSFNEMYGFVFYIAVLVVIFAMVLAYYLSRRVILPINLLIGAAESITAHNYKAPLTVRTDSELDTLVSHFNDMQQAIQVRESELKKANEELRVQRLEAIEANRLKSQFLANMSHELRTPLNSIIGFTTRVMKKTADILPEVQQENLKIVREEAQHLLELINSLLDYSKMEAGKMEVHAESFNLADVIAEVRNMVKPMLEGKQLQYEEELCDPGNIPVFSDRIKVKQILINLVSNAFKYSEKGTVRLSVYREESRYHIQVADEGVGIAQEDIDRIFDEFRQVDGTYTRKVGGTGLGLSITKRFVEMLGGTIQVESTLNEGSCFHVFLPNKVSLQEEMECVNRQIAISGKTQVKVVCVDDDPNVQRLYKQYLSDEDFQLVGLDGTGDVLASILEEMPDIVLLDIMLPNRDGWEILGDLKSRPETRKIPVIMISVLSEKNLAYRMMADEYLIKPIGQEELVEALVKTMEKREGIDVLIADDDENYLNLMGQLLRDEGIHYRTARDGNIALEQIGIRKPDVLILDIMMPNRDGFSVMEEIRRMDGCQDLPIIVVTAKSLSKKEKAELISRSSAVIEKSGTHMEKVLDILSNRIRERMKKW